VLRISATLLALLALTAAASAQVPTSGNIFFGYSYASAQVFSQDHNNLNGWNGSLEGKVFPWVGIVADISGHYGSDDVVVPCLPPGPCSTIRADASVYNVLFGPRVSASVGKIRPFAHALFGAGHVSTNGFNSDTSFATALGGGIDYRMFPVVGWRVQADYVQDRFFGDTQNNFRLSTGIVLHF